MSTPSEDDVSRETSEKPTVIIPGRPVPDYVVAPRSLAWFAAAAERSGWIVGAITWALASQPGVRRKTPGATGEGSMAYVRVALESIVVRVLEPGWGCRAFVAWERQDGAAWKPMPGVLRSPIVGQHMVTHDRLKVYMSTGELPPIKAPYLVEGMEGWVKPPPRPAAKRREREHG